MKHCWTDRFDGLEFGSDAWVQAMLGWPDGATCMLPEGHDGPHIWTSDAEIEFLPTEENDA